MPVRAYEFLHGLPTYENTHPPLGKILISVGIAIFGMNSFGWRIMGTLFGIAMLPFLYLLGKKMTGNTPAAALTCFLFAFDFMHFTQTRIATIDVYITFFVIAMYYFMYSYCSMSFYDTPLHKTFIPLGLCGVCMGLALPANGPVSMPDVVWHCCFSRTCCGATGNTFTPKHIPAKVQTVSTINT